MSRRVRPATPFRPGLEALELRDTPAGIFAAPALISDPNLGPNTTVTAVGKFNADDIPDVAVTNYSTDGPSTISVLLGQGNGTFRPATRVTVDPTGRLPEGLVALDIDGDRDTDLAVVLNQGSARNVVVLRNQGLATGTFQTAQVLTAGDSATHVTAADLDGDGDQDLAVANYGGGVKILRNSGGVFGGTAPLVPTGGGKCNVIVASDLDGDGDKDIAVANQENGTVGILRNNGAASFSFVRTLTAGPGTTFLAAADLNGDNRPDLVASNTFGNTVSVFTGKGTCAFDPARNTVVGTSPTGVVIQDFTGDGLADVAVGVANTGRVAVLRNNGALGFLPTVTYAAAGGANGLAVADFNRDGRPDLMVTQYIDGSQLAVLTNQLTPTTVAVAVPATAGTAGSPATFTATVRVSVGSAPTTGFVSFLDGNNYLGTVTVTNGVAKFTTSALAAGSHSIRVVYSDAVSLRWNGSQSAAVPYTVNAALSLGGPFVG